MYSLKTSSAKLAHRKSDKDLRIAAPSLLNSSHMRRVLTLLLLAIFGLPTVAPLLAMGQDIDGHLPACCRRIGAHHCMSNMGEPSKAPAFSARCPEFPQTTMTAPAGTLLALAASSLSVLNNNSPLAAIQQAETQRCISRERSHHKRGPPAVFL